MMQAVSSSEEVLALSLAKEELDQLQETNSNLLTQLNRYEEQMQTKSKETEFYRKRMNTLQQDLQGAQQQNSRLEEQLYTRDQELEGLRLEVQGQNRQRREIQKQMREETQQFENERQLWSEKEASLQDQLGAVQKQLHKVLDEKPGRARARSHAQTHRFKSASTDSIAAPISAEELMERERQMTIAQKNIREQDKLILELRDKIDKQKNITEDIVGQYKRQSLQIAYLENELEQLKQTNTSLQEDNESYQMLLQEKTMNGQFSLGDTYTDDEPMPPTPGLGQDLATELSRAALTPSIPMTPEYSGSTSSREQELENELKTVKDENKAFALYINKILTRIMESNQMENILARDFDKTKVTRDQGAPASPPSLTFSPPPRRRSSLMVTPSMLSSKPNMPNGLEATSPVSPESSGWSPRKWRRHQSLSMPKGSSMLPTADKADSNEGENNQSSSTVASGGLRRAWRRMSVMGWKYPAPTTENTSAIVETAGIPEE